MKKIEKRLHRDNMKIERYTCAECLPPSCTCAGKSTVYTDRNLDNVAASERLSYRRS